MVVAGGQVSSFIEAAAAVGGLDSRVR